MNFSCANKISLTDEKLTDSCQSENKSIKEFERINSLSHGFLTTDCTLHWESQKAFGICKAPSTLRRRNLKTQQSPVILDLCLRKTRAGKSHDYRNVIDFGKFSFPRSESRAHLNAEPAAFSNYSSWKSVFDELPFRDRLVWTVGLTVEIKLGFQISPP